MEGSLLARPGARRILVSDDMDADPRELDSAVVSVPLKTAVVPLIARVVAGDGERLQRPGPPASASTI